MKILEQVFTWLTEASLILNLAKCEFGKATSYVLRKTGEPRSGAPHRGQSVQFPPLGELFAGS